MSLVYERPDQKEWEFHGSVTDDGAYLIITVAKGTDDKYRILYQPLAEPNAPFVELIDNFDHEYSFLDNDGPVFWFKTDRDAPRGRVIAIDTRKPEPENWKEIIPEADETLNGVSVVGDRFIASYLKDAHTQVKVFDLRRNACPRGRPAGPGDGLRVRRQAIRSRDVLLLHLVQLASDDLSL